VSQSLICSLQAITKSKRVQILALRETSLLSNRRRPGTFISVALVASIGKLAIQDNIRVC